MRFRPFTVFSGSVLVSSVAMLPTMKSDVPAPVAAPATAPSSTSRPPCSTSGPFRLKPGWLALEVVGMKPSSKPSSRIVTPSRSTRRRSAVKR